MLPVSNPYSNAILSFLGSKTTSLEDAYNKHHIDNNNNNRQFSNRNRNLGPGQFNQRQVNFNATPAQFNSRLDNFNQGQANVLGELRVLTEGLARNVQNMGNMGNGMNGIGGNGNFVGDMNRNILNNCVMMANQNQMWNPHFVGEQYVEEQQENINRYGGPIHRPAWDLNNMSQQQINQVTLQFTTLSWLLCCEYEINRFYLLPCILNTQQ